MDMEKLSYLTLVYILIGLSTKGCHCLAALVWRKAIQKLLTQPLEIQKRQVGGLALTTTGASQAIQMSQTQLFLGIRGHCAQYEIPAPCSNHLCSTNT